MIHDLTSLLGQFGRRLGLAAPEPIHLSVAEWEALQARVPFIVALSPTDREALRERIGEFLATRQFVGIGLELLPWQRQLIAAYAALPVLHLGIDSYRDWKTVIVYPDTFVPEQEWVDEAGVHHRAVVPQAGEAWERGPVVLSWSDIAADGAVIVHEMTHTLDAANGEVNGFPLLPKTLSAPTWTAVFTAAFEALNADLERGEEPAIDPYAATEPAEFLAVASEYFFFSPAYLREALPEVYAQLSGYFRQEPHLRAPEIDTAIPRTVA